jgi:flagella basal body P-ring formation protein FlgA
MRNATRIVLAALLGLAAAAPAVSGTAGRDALSRSVREAVTSAVVDQAGVPGAEAIVSGVRFRDASQADGGGEVVRVLPGGGSRSGRGIPFDLFVRSQDGDVREMRVVADVSIQVPVVVAARNIAPGAVLGPEDLAVRQKDISAAGEATLRGLSDAIGKRTRWQLSGGVPVRREYLEDPEALKRGDTVLIEAETGAVRITGKGVALQSGRVGETVTVRSQLSGKEMAGVLAAGRVVRVD